MTARRPGPAPPPATDAARYADRNSKPKKGHLAFLTHWPDSIGGCVSLAKFLCKNCESQCCSAGQLAHRATQDQKRMQTASTTARNTQHTRRRSKETERGAPATTYSGAQKQKSQLTHPKARDGQQPEQQLSG